MEVNEMWNLFKSDVYRLLHSRFFFVLTLLYTLMTILLVSTEGVIVSNTSFASFDGRTSTLADFLAFLPKNAIFLFFVFLAYILFLSEEYQSRYVKSIYPFFQRKEKLIFARIMTFAAIWCLYILIGVLWSSFWLGALIGRTGTLILPDYLLFLLAQLLCAEMIALILSLLIHIIGGKVLPILFMMFYSFGAIFLLLSAAGTYFEIDCSKYLPYYLSGALPLTAESGPYLQLFGIIGLLTILTFCADLLVLRKKDL